MKRIRGSQGSDPPTPSLKSDSRFLNRSVAFTPELDSELLRIEPMFGRLGA